MKYTHGCNKDICNTVRCSMNENVFKYFIGMIIFQFTGF